METTISRLKNINSDSGKLNGFEEFISAVPASLFIFFKREMVVSIRACESKVRCKLTRDRVPVFLFISTEIGFYYLLSAL
jgi:hypothetical protein